MKKLPMLLCFVLALFLTISVASQTLRAQGNETENKIAQQITVDTKKSLKLWAKLHEVFSHPRCVNCHVGADNIPRWSGPSYGKKVRPHGMNIDAGESRIGTDHLQCSTCHSKQNSAKRHGPPGAEGWALAPVEMQWFGKTSKEICEQVKDKERNGDRTLLEVVDHIDHDPLVAWGWQPGPGREPAPYSKKEVMKIMQNWIATGALCPTS